MRVRDLDTIDNYRTAADMLGNHNERTIAHNTRLVRRGDDVAVRYHATDIVTYHADGRITLDTGGWDTMTTISRMHAMTPATVRVYRRDWQARLELDGAETTLAGPLTLDA